MGTRIEDLTELVQSQAKILASRYGIKGMLSAGVLLLSKLDEVGQVRAVDEANATNTTKETRLGPSTLPKKSLQDAIQIIKEMCEVERQQPGTVFRVLAPEEQAVIEEFRKLISPEKKAKKTRLA